MGKQSKKRRAAAVEATTDEVARPRPEPARPRSPLPGSSPGAIGAYLGVGLGIGFLILALWGLGSDALPFPLILGMILVGALQVVCSWLTLRRARVAWSFAVSMSGTIALTCLFGAPKIRDAMEIGIGVAMLPSVLAAVTTIFLAMAADAISSRS